MTKRNERITKVSCHDCGVDLGFIRWGTLTPTDQIRCSRCGLRDLGVEP